MQLRIYDIFSNLIPGFIVYLSLLKLFGKSYGYLGPIEASVAAYVIGFFVNTLSGWFESFLYITWGGKPSNKVINGKSTFRIKFHEIDKVKELLKKDCSIDNPSNDALFNVAMRFSNSYEGEGNKRIIEFNETYIFSRNILTAIIISAVIFCYYYSVDNTRFHIAILVSILLVLINWYRCKERAYYYVKEVLNFYMSKKNS